MTRFLKKSQSIVRSKSMKAQNALIFFFFQERSDHESVNLTNEHEISTNKEFLTYRSCPPIKDGSYI
jgi:hypothetical protein